MNAKCRKVLLLLFYYYYVLLVVLVCDQTTAYCVMNTSMFACVAHTDGRDSVRRRTRRAHAHQQVIRSLRTSRRPDWQPSYDCPSPLHHHRPPIVLRYAYRQLRQQLLAAERNFSIAGGYVSFTCLKITKSSLSSSSSSSPSSHNISNRFIGILAHF